MNKRFQIILYIILFLTSCKKREEIHNDFSGNYSSSKTATVTRTQMFIANKVITDWNAINNFLLKNELVAGDPLIKNIKEKTAPANFNLHLTVEKNNKTKVDFNYGSIFGEGLVFEGNFEINNNEMIIRAPKPDTLYLSGYFPSSQFSSAGIPIVKPLTPSNIYGGSSVADYTSIISTKKLILITKDNELYLPVLDYFSTQAWNGGRSRSWAVNFNTFGVINPDLNTKLNVQDTVVVQEYLLKLVKQK